MSNTENKELTPKEQIKEDNKIVPAYTYTTESGNTMVVSCPKRLLEKVQRDGQLDLRKNFKKVIEKTNE